MWSLIDGEVLLDFSDFQKDMIRAKGDQGPFLWRRAGGFKIKLTHKSLQEKRHFVHGKPISDAEPGTTPEREEGFAGVLCMFAHEFFRIERQWVFPVFL